MSGWGWLGLALVAQAIAIAWLASAVRRARAQVRDLQAGVQGRIAAETAVLAEVAELADTANRAKSEFLANMSHEIRTPLNAVIGLTEVVLDTDLAPFQRDHLRTVLDSGETLLHLINEVLDCSKIEAGKMSVERIPFRL